MAEIALIGPLARDLVGDAAPRPGGAVFHAARAYARMGIHAWVTASCSAADRDDLLRPLEALGLETSWHPSAETATYAFHYEGDRRVMRQEAVADSWSAREAVEAAGDARWVHVGSLVRTDFPAATLASLAVGRTLLVDGQGLVRAPALGALQQDDDVGDALDHVTVLKLDEEETGILAGSLDVGAIRRLAVPEVVVTQGSRGSFVVTEDTVEHAEVTPLPGRVDPTGAGDTFSAAYLAARSGGAEPGEALRAATAFTATLLAERALAP